MHYRFFRETIMIALLFSCALAFGCSPGFFGEDEADFKAASHIEPSTVASVVHHIEPVVPETTSTLAQKLSGVSAVITHGTDSITISPATNAPLGSPADLKINAGDILAGGISEGAPHGYLKKITSVRQENGNIYIGVANVSLGEAVRHAHLNFKQPLKRKHIVSFSPAIEGVKLNDTEFFNDTVSIDINAVVYDEDGNLKTTNDQIKATGKFELGYSLDGEMKIENFNLTYFKLYGKYKGDQKLSISSAKSLKAKKVFKLAEFAITPFTFFIGPVPVVVVPKLVVNLTFEGSLSAKVTFAVDQTISFAIGFLIDKGKISPYGEGPVCTFVPSQSFGMKAAFEAGIGPEVEASIYGLAGPSLGAKFYFSAEANIQETNYTLSSNVDVKAGLKGTISGQIDALTKQLGKLELTVFNTVFWHSTIPIISPISPNSL